MIIEGNLLSIPKILDMAEVLKDTPREELKKLLISSLALSDAKLYVAEKDGNIRGYVLATIETFAGEVSVFVQSCVIYPGEENKYIGFELLLKIKLWAKEKGLRNIYFMTERNPEAWIKKYKFEFSHTVLKTTSEV